MDDRHKHEELRRTARDRLARFALPDVESMSTGDVAALVEELQIHQIELELQNEELQRANEALQSAREWYYAMFEASAMPLLLVGPGPVILDANLAAAEYLKWTRRAITSQPLVKYFVADQHAAVSAALAELWNTRSTHTQLTSTMLPRGGEARHVELRCARVEADGAQGLLVSIVDIHEREQTRRATETALVESRRASQLKTQFLANISHELRAPLTSIIGYLDMVLTGRDPEHAEQMLTIARRAAELLLTMVKDLLDLSQIEADRLALSRKPVALAELGAEIHEMFKSQAEGAGLELRLELQPELPAAVLGDGYRLRQILMNLVMNALKFTRSGHVTLELAYRERNAIFVVSDTGAGIQEDRLTRIFEPFEQADPSDSRSHGGAGLGLSLCRRLVEQMSGAIYVRSEPGKGSRFTVQVPLPSLSAAELTPPRAVVRQPRGPEIKARILVVDDDPNLTRLFELCLQAVGHSVTTAASGAEALARLAERPFQLVVLDMQMPQMDGYVVAEQIRTRFSPSKLPIVAVSASAMAHERQRSLASGCNGFIAKPVNIRTFADEVIKHLPSV